MLIIARRVTPIVTVACRRCPPLFLVCYDTPPCYLCHHAAAAMMFIFDYYFLPDVVFDVAIIDILLVEHVAIMPRCLMMPAITSLLLPPRLVARY